MRESHIDLRWWRPLQKLTNLLIESGNHKNHDLTRRSKILILAFPWWLSLTNLQNMSWEHKRTAINYLLNECNQNSMEKRVSGECLEVLSESLKYVFLNYYNLKQLTFFSLSVHEIHFHSLLCHITYEHFLFIIWRWPSHDNRKCIKFNLLFNYF